MKVLTNSVASNEYDRSQCNQWKEIFTHNSCIDQDFTKIGKENVKRHQRAIQRAHDDIPHKLVWIGFGLITILAGGMMYRFFSEIWSKVGMLCGSAGHPERLNMSGCSQKDGLASF